MTREGRAHPGPNWGACRRLLVLTCIIGGFLHAEAPHATGEILTFLPDADVYVQASEPDTNTASDARLKADADPERIIYLRFTVSGVAGRPVETARLLLDVVGPSDSGGTIHEISMSTWDENAITFNNRPIVNGPPIETLGSAARGDTVEFSLDGTVTADETYSFAIDSTSSDGVTYQSTSGTEAAPPRLILTVSDAPESPEPPTESSVLEFSPVADAYVDVSRPTTNYGSNAELRVDADVERTSYLRFEVTGVEGGTVERARLKLEASRNSVVGGTIHVIGDGPWAEDTITYANRPPTDTPVLDALGPVSSGDHVAFVLDGAISADGTYNLVIDSPSDDGLAYHSSDSSGGERPVLELTLGPPAQPPPNSPPVVTITSPADGASLASGQEFSLNASATDLEDGLLNDSIVWTSNLDGALGTGPSVTTTLSDGDHVVMAAVTDNDGAEGSHSLSVHVESLTALELRPIADAYVNSARPTRNYGDDDELIIDADVERLSYLRFEVTGLNGYTVTQALLRMEVSRPSDSGGTVHQLSNSAWDESTITYNNRATNVGVGLDSAGPVEPGDVVDFNLGSAITGTGTYDFVLDTTSTDGVGFHSSESTTGHQPVLALMLSDESDAGGDPPAGPNAPPMVTIASPVDAAVLVEGEPEFLNATASDPEEGSLSANVVWTSSLDGTLGTGGSLAVPLSPGNHEITATVFDSEGLSDTASVSVRVDAVVVLEFTATEDAYVDAHENTTNYGSSSRMRVDAKIERLSYLQFKISGVGASRVINGTLRLQVDDSSSAPSDSGGSVYLTAGLWSEEQVTYNTRPPVRGDPLDTVGPVEREQFVEFDVTDAVMVGDGTQRFTLVNESEDGVDYRSRESSSPPMLILTVVGPTEAGFPGVMFGPGVDVTGNRVTASKPESKLWHNDGLWWASLFNPAGTPGHRIHALDPLTQTWLDTGVAVDERPDSRQDILWNGQKLYAVSRASLQNRLYRFSYDAAGPIYTLDPGFPVDIPGGGAESINIAQDSTGKLWIAYVLAGQVFVGHSETDDTTWGTPFVVPVAEGTAVSLDDIAGVQAIAGAIGVFWTNQLTDTLYFAVHPDGRSTTDPVAWKLEIAALGGSLADDHFNLKLGSDGRLFAVIKTSYSEFHSPLVEMLVRSPAGVWSPPYEIASVQFEPNRPQCLLDEAAGLVYVFYSVANSGIYYKTSPINAVAFEEGLGTPLVESADATDINGPTTTKQSVDETTGIVVVGASTNHHTYWHNTIGLP